jgi:hypothetical protein
MIISFTSKWSAGNIRTRTLMHQSTVQFINKEGQTIALETDISSGGEPLRRVIK